MTSETNAKLIDYSNTIIYKISCKDTNITNTYVGHTINFCQRQQSHKYNCNNEQSICYNYKLYETIRQNGGWNNWKMDIVNFFNCINKYEALQKEQEYFLLLNADLNSIEPIHNKQIKKCKKQKQIIIENEQNNVIMSTCCKYSCNICSYFTIRKSQYDRHLNTNKHKNISKILKYKSKALREYKCICGKVYNYDSGYYRHKKTCNKDQLNNQVSLKCELKNILVEILDNIKQNNS